VTYKPGAGGAIAYNYGILSNNVNPNITMMSVGGVTEQLKTKDLATIEKEATLIGPVWAASNVLAVSLKSGITSLDELIKRGTEGRLNCGASAASVKLGLEYFKPQTGMKNTEIVLFKGSPDIMPLLISGELDCSLETYPGLFENAHKAGQIKLIASSDMTPSPLFPNLPLMKTQVKDQSVHLFSWWLALAISNNSHAGFKEKIMPVLTKAVKSMEPVGSVRITALDKADKSVFAQQNDSARKMTQALAK
jgi:tripartite-type tricarboxylate transporter receptor subunit TctC